MTRPLRILLVEDNPLDAELLVMALRRAGFAPEWQRVQEEAEYLQQLDGNLDLVLSDYLLPRFNALRALKLLQARGLAVPFIIVSGSMTDDVVDEAMQHGASAFVLKGMLAPLCEAIDRVLKQARPGRGEPEA